MRRSLSHVAGIPAEDIRITTKLSRLYRTRGKREFWHAFTDHSGFVELSPPTLLSGINDVRDLLLDLLTSGIRHLRPPNGQWTRSLVRTCVRASVIRFVGRKRFSDDAHFVKDIGLD